MCNFTLKMHVIASVFINTYVELRKLCFIYNLYNHVNIFKSDVNYPIAFYFSNYYPLYEGKLTSETNLKVKRIAGVSLNIDYVFI